MKLYEFFEVCDDTVVILGPDKESGTTLSTIYSGQSNLYDGEDREIQAVFSEVCYPTGSYSSDDYYSRTVIELKPKE